MPYDGPTQPRATLHEDLTPERLTQWRCKLARPEERPTAEQAVVLEAVITRVQYERKLERDMFESYTLSDQGASVHDMWPKIESETGFLLSLVTPLPRPWTIHVLQAASDTMWASKIEKGRWWRCARTASGEGKRAQRRAVG